ncbi:MAG TPA: lamin tail domain-containing protein [Thermoanaerobaculia bacterium]|nr:lamin tail domain-containing protein [Thermoanaerobaculia bacterium]
MRKYFCAAVALFLFALPSFAQSGIFISEYVEGTSNNKAIEIYNGTGAPVNMANYQIRMYFNGSASAGLTISLAGTVAAGDVFVVSHTQASPVIQAQADAFNGAGWFNGDDAVALYHVPSASFVDVLGQIGFDPGTQWGTGLVSTEDNTIRRKPGVTTGDPNGTNTFDPSIEWDGFATNEFSGLGVHNAVPPPPPPATVYEIFEIQGSGNASPYAGQTVETRDNIVTAVGSQGFFMQTPDYRADASSATSNGIYVFTSSAPAVQPGDQVDVQGTVVEFFDLTEFTNAGLVVTVDTHNQPLPAYTTLAAGVSNFETREGMLVRVTNGAACDGTDQFGETMIVAASTRPFRVPGIAGNAHPEILDVDPTGLGGAAPSIVGGATITLAEGPLTYEFGDYSIWTTSLAYTNPLYPRGPRARNAGEMTVAAQNLFRLFDTNDDPLLGEPVTAPAVYAARLSSFSQLVRNVLGSPDVVAVSEVENLSTLQDLADQIHFDDAGVSYTAYLEEGNDVGGIDVGFLVRDTLSVDAIEQLGANDTWIDPNTNAPALLNDRPPLLLRGSYTGNGAPYPIAVIAVHQRSLIDVETSARVREKRELQAEKLADYVNALPSGTRVVVTGDFNAFPFDDGYVDVMHTVTANAGLTNQVLTVAANDRYSYVEEGVAQVLDHTLTSTALNPFVRGAAFGHANADAPSSAAAPSDHDGVVLFVMTDHDGDGFADDQDNCATGDARPTVILDGCDSGVANPVNANGCSLTDQLTALHAAAKNHGQFVSSVAKLLNEWMKNGVITGAQKGALESCVARWN